MGWIMSEAVSYTSSSLVTCVVRRAEVGERWLFCVLPLREGDGYNRVSWVAEAGRKQRADIEREWRRECPKCKNVKYYENIYKSCDFIK